MEDGVADDLKGDWGKMTNDATTFRVAHGFLGRLPKLETRPRVPAFQPWAGMTESFQDS